MKIGIIVEGQAEHKSLPTLLSCLNNVITSTILLQPVLATVTPDAPIPQIARTILSRVPVLTARGVDTVIVLLDLEKQLRCPGDWAREIEEALESSCNDAKVDRFIVVAKNGCYENWLIADVSTLRRMGARFEVTQAVVNQIAPDKADRVDAQKLLKHMARKRDYEKVRDALSIMRYAGPLEIAANSRSFRRFLRVIEHPAYLEQSRHPNIGV